MTAAATDCDSRFVKPPGLEQQDRRLKEKFGKVAVVGEALVKSLEISQAAFVGTQLYKITGRQIPKRAADVVGAEFSFLSCQDTFYVRDLFLDLFGLIRCHGPDLPPKVGNI
jgi:hypothetical protein